MSSPMSTTGYSSSTDQASAVGADNPFFKVSVRGLDSGLEAPSTPPDNNEEQKNNKFRMGQEVIGSRGGDSEKIEGKIVNLVKNSDGEINFVIVMDNKTEKKVRLPVANVEPMEDIAPPVNRGVGSAYVPEENETKYMPTSVTEWKESQ